jgi:transcriptional antiterminator
MEGEQRLIIKILRFKGMKLVNIHHELTEVFGEETYALPRVKYWINQLKTSRTIMIDDVRPGRPSIEQIDALILKQLSETPFASIRSLSKDLEIPKTTVRRRLTESLQFKSRHFK